MWTTDRVRQTFIEYFKDLGHKHTPSSPVIPPEEDNTLLFANAGMNQFKPIFLNKEHSFGDLKRATNSQNCIRAGGKHNDLEDVGKDLYHHTFFEMMGSWSFGDYWKEEAIEWSYKLLIDVYKLDPERIYVTYFGGNEELGLGADTETRDIWMRYLPEDRILPFGMEDNFWEMGETGPCGPCTEIHYNRYDQDLEKSSDESDSVSDTGTDTDTDSREADETANRPDKVAQLVNKDDPNVMEIWNIVFMQFNRISKTDLVDLPKKHVDTGLGLERLVSILQGVNSNYDIDTFTPIFNELNFLAKDIHPYTGKVGVNDVREVDTSYRIVVDHARMMVVSISDGLRPGNNLTGNVLRQIIRRAIKYGLLNLKILRVNKGDLLKSKGRYTYKLFLHRLVPIVCKTLEEGLPKLRNSATVELITKVVKEEEERYIQMLSRGLNKFTNLFDKYRRRAEYKNVKTFRGDDIYKLYKTYGFPLEFSVFEAQERGYNVDIEGFNKSRKETIEKETRKGI